MYLCLWVDIRHKCIHWQYCSLLMCQSHSSTYHWRADSWSVVLGSATCGVSWVAYQLIRWHLHFSFTLSWRWWWWSHWSKLVIIGNGWNSRTTWASSRASLRLRLLCTRRLLPLIRYSCCAIWLTRDSYGCCCMFQSYILYLVIAVYLHSLIDRRSELADISHDSSTDAPCERLHALSHPFPPVLQHYYTDMDPLILCYFVLTRAQLPSYTGLPKEILYDYHVPRLLLPCLLFYYCQKTLY